MTKKKRILATLDIETPDGLKGTKFEVGGFYAKYRRKEYLIVERDKKTFFEKVLDFCKDKRVIIFIHNLDFDIRFFLDYIHEHTEYDPFIIQSNSKTLEVRIKELDLILRDSFQFFLTDQANVEKMLLGRQIKFEMSFTNVEDRSLYNKRVVSDVKGLYMCLEKYIDYYRERKIYFLRYSSLASFAFAIFKKSVKEQFKMNILDINPYVELDKNFNYKWRSERMKKVYYWTRKAYFGGRTEIFNVSKLENIFYYDFNSLYPSVCAKRLYPLTNDFVFLKDITISDFVRLKENKLYIVEATVIEDDYIPILPVRVEKPETKVFFANGKKRGVWASPEFEEFLKNPNNKILEIHAVKIFNKKINLYQKFMEERYHMRQNAKEEFERHVLKIEMNSVYGKTGQKPERESWTLFNQELYDEMVEIRNEPTDIIVKGGFKLMKYKTEAIKDYTLVDLSLFISSYAKVELYRLIKEIHKAGYEVYYCDTDSVFTNCPMEKVFPEKIGLDMLQLKNELVEKEIKKIMKTIIEIRKEYIKEEVEINKILPMIRYLNREYKIDPVKLKNLIDYEPYSMHEELINHFIDVISNDEWNKSIEEAKFILPKTYILKVDGEFEVKAKGISVLMIYQTLGLTLEKTEYNYKKFQEKFESIEQIEEFLKIGVSMKRYLKIRSSIRQNATILSAGEIKKRIVKVYDKRKPVGEEGITYPYELEEVLDEEAYKELLEGKMGEEEMEIKEDYLRIKT